jgi:hypothetical protein
VDLAWDGEAFVCHAVTDEGLAYARFSETGEELEPLTVVATATGIVDNPRLLPRARRGR